MPNLYDKFIEDPRLPYLVVILLIILGAYVAVAPSGFTSPFVKRAYDVVQTIEPGDLVFYYGFFRGVTYPEQWSATLPVFRDLKERGAIFVIMATTEENVVLIPKLMNEFWGPNWEEHPDYGKTFIYLGYLPGSTGLIYSLSKDFKSVFSTDYFGTDLNDFPATKNVENATSFKLALNNMSSHGRSFASLWFIPFGVPSLSATGTGGFASGIDYWRAGTLEFVAGSRLGAEYEALSGQAGGLNQRVMSSLFLVVSFVFVGLLLNNINYIRRRSGGSD